MSSDDSIKSSSSDEDEPLTCARCEDNLDNWPDDKRWMCTNCCEDFCDNCHQTEGGLVSLFDDHAEEWACKDCYDDAIKERDEIRKRRRKREEKHQNFLKEIMELDQSLIKLKEDMDKMKEEHEERKKLREEDLQKKVVEWNSKMDQAPANKKRKT